MAPPTFPPMAAPANMAPGSPDAIWLVPQLLHAKANASNPMKYFFMPFNT
jgi:hypothetical protein